jgi:serine/threonine protein kinase
MPSQLPPSQTTASETSSRKKQHVVLQGRFERVRKMCDSEVFSLSIYRDLSDNKKVVLKSPKKSENFTPEEYIVIKMALCMEAEALSRIQHPGVINLISQGDGYLILEYLKGRNLWQMLKSGRIRESLALQAAIRLCDILESVHGAGIIHRDIKPENIIYGGKSFRLFDFEAARVPLTVDVYQNCHIGSPEFAAPENIDASKVNERSDLFSVGATLFSLLSSEIVFVIDPNDDHRRTLRNIGVLLSKTPPRYHPVLARALQESPDVRYQSAAEMKEDLLRIGL